MPTGDLGMWLDDSADPALFVIGSAISYASPAGAPSAHAIVSATAQGLAKAADPHGALSQLSYIQVPPWELLPESLYAALDQIHGQGVHGRVWGTVSVDGPAPGDPRPNAGHHLVAVAAARTRGTVVTTNFDPFLEQALADLGIPHQVLTGLDVWNGRRPVAGEVLVLKVHGDAGTLKAWSARLLTWRGRGASCRRCPGPAGLVVPSSWAIAGVTSTSFHGSSGKAAWARFAG